MSESSRAPGPPPDPGAGASRVRRRALTLAPLFLAVVLAVVLKSWVAQAYYIPSESMEPGLVKDDRILVEKPSYWFSDGPERGDVVVFRDPGGWLPGDPPRPGAVATLAGKLGLLPEGEHLVKRVIGVPGDVIGCCDQSGRLLVNGVSFPEDSFIEPQERCDGPMTGTCSWRAGPVPDGAYFVMGDNRDDSGDSSVHMCAGPAGSCSAGGGYVDEDLIVGKVVLRFWPGSRVGTVTRPRAFDALP